jgi:hypothetical protein
MENVSEKGGDYKAKPKGWLGRSQRLTGRFGG